MAERQWFVIIERVTGRAVSYCTVVADPLPAELEAIPLLREPDHKTEIWDVRLKVLKPRPADIIE